MSARIRFGFRFWIVLAAALAALCAPAFADKRVALVIGNDRYANLPAERQLQKAINDAEAVGDALSRLGFQVIRGRNLGRQGMIDKLAEFTARLETGDTAAFFYAGHGVAIGGVNYLVPADVPPVSEGAEVRVRGASIAEPDLVAEIQAKKPRVVFLALDACRDNPFPRTPGRSIGQSRGLADTSPARGVFTIYSAGIGQSALDGLEPNDPNRNSVFTRVFVNELAQPGLDLGSLAIEVREKVAVLALKAKNSAGQADPQEQTPAYYDQTVGGRIYLAGLPRRQDVANPPSSDPVALPAPSDDVAWTILKGTTDVAALRRFMAEFPGGSHRGEAESRIAALEAEQARQARERAAQDDARRQQLAARPPDTPTRPARPRKAGENCASASAAAGIDNYCASSVLSPELGNSYGVRNLFAASSNTAWVEGVPGQGIGEWIVVEFDNLRSVDGIVIENGYQKNSDIYRKNSRVRRLRAVFSQGESRTFALQDRQGEQTLNLNGPIKAYWVQFVIEDVYPGNKYTDTAISKLRISSQRAP